REALADLIPRLDPLFDAALQPVDRYPAIRALTTGEVFTLLIYMLLLVTIPIRGVFRSFLIHIAVVITLSALGTWMWKSMYPNVHDALKYRSIIDSPGFAAGGSKAIRTPVPFGENDNVLEDARQAPTWLLAAEQRTSSTRYH